MGQVNKKQQELASIYDSDNEITVAWVELEHADSNHARGDEPCADLKGEDGVGRRDAEFFACFGAIKALVHEVEVAHGERRSRAEAVAVYHRDARLGASRYEES
jgi:hypothetical protein